MSRSDSMPIQQDSQWFIPLMQSLGYPIDKEGMCFGLAQMAMQASLCEEQDKFNDRLAFLHQYCESENTNQLKIDLDAVRQKLKADKTASLSEREQALIEVAAFFDGLQLYQLGHVQHKTLLGLDEKANYAWFEVARKSSMPLVTPEKLLANGGKIQKIGQYNARYSKYILKKLFMNMSSVVDSIEFPVSIVLSAHVHAITISFDPKRQRWSLIDANNLPPITFDFDDIAKLVDAVHKCIAERTSARHDRQDALMASLYVHNDNAKAPKIVEFKAELKRTLKLKPTKNDRVDLKIARLARLITEAVNADDKKMLAKLHNDCLRLIRRIDNRDDLDFKAALLKLAELRDKIESIAHQEIAENILLTKEGKPPEHLSSQQQQGLLRFIHMRQNYQAEMKLLLASPFKPVGDNPLLSNESILNSLDKIKAYITPPVSLFDFPMFEKIIVNLHYQVENLTSGNLLLKKVESEYHSIKEYVDVAIETKDAKWLAANLDICLGMTQYIERIVAVCEKGSSVEEKLVIFLEELDSTRFEIETNMVAIMEDHLQTMQNALSVFHDNVTNKKVSSLKIVFAMASEVGSQLDEFKNLIPSIPDENREALVLTIAQLESEVNTIKEEAQAVITGKESEKKTEDAEKVVRQRSFK